jgi:hypothetical protein
MFRLMKLLAYALFGYALYEFVRGMSDTGAMGGGQGASGGQRSGGAMRGADRGEGQISGPGEGRPEATLESDGGSVRHRVGRGVIPSGM